MKATKPSSPSLPEEVTAFAADGVRDNGEGTPKRRSRFRGFSVRGKIYLTFLLFTTLAIGLLWLFQIVFLDQIYRAIKMGHLERGAEAILQKVGEDDLFDASEEISERYDFSAMLVYPDTGSMQKLTEGNRPGMWLQNSVLFNLTLPECKELIEQAEAAGGSYLQSVRYVSEGNRHPDSPNSPDSPDAPDAPNSPDAPNRHPAPESDAQPDRPREEANPLFQEEEIQSVIYVKTFPAADGSTAALLIHATITPLSAARETLFYILLTVSVVLLGLSILLAAIISRSVVRPIEEINRGAKRLAEGDYSYHFPEKRRYREAAELAATLNYTSAELAKVENLRRELIANVSHDLRTPLTLIAGYSEVMRDLPGEITPENLQTIIDESARLTSLVNDLLEISKIQSGNLTPVMESFSFSEMLRESVFTYEALATCRGYHFTLQIDGEAEMIGDRSMIVRALNNLINNALTYTGEDRQVIIRQIATPHRVRVEVTDTGAGIPKEKLHDIWDRYYKVDAEHKRSAVGTGLGLSIVKSIVSLHEGSYGVKSSNGYGSTFWFELRRK
ncbi:MAG: HAMP domain-containing protein [Clostridia bacterium]|nr:HAMP domain-containing protein [Clostridia bacterium]